MNIALVAIVSIILVGIYLSLRKDQNTSDPAVIERELESVRQKIKDFELESIRVVPKNDSPKNLWSSKFGGTPYWPKVKEYPLDGKGRPLLLLAQFNLEEIPTINGFPSSGILQFLISQNNSWGLEYPNKKRSLIDIINAPKEYKVVFHEKVSNNQNEIFTSSPYKLKKKSLPFNGEYSLSFEKVMDRLSPSDYRFENIIKNFDDLDEVTIDELFEELDSSGCKLGGYAHFTQEDPRGYSNIGDWVLLFQMDSISHDGVDIMWGDAGVANFFIRPENLIKLDFNHILYNWDCC